MARPLRAATVWLPRPGKRAGTQKWVYQVLAPIGGLFCGIIAIVLWHYRDRLTGGRLCASRWCHSPVKGSKR